MKTIILWLFNQIALFIETSMTWKIYGDFSLTHFILASLFLLALFNLFGFATHNFGTGVENITIGYKNAENKRDKKNYYNHSYTTSTYKKVGGIYVKDSVTMKGKMGYKNGNFIPTGQTSNTVIGTTERS